MGCLHQIIKFAFYLHLCWDGLHFEVELHTIDKDYLVLSLGVVIFISKYYILTSSLISMKLNKLNCLDKAMPNNCDICSCYQWSEFFFTIYKVIWPTSYGWYIQIWKYYCSILSVSLFYTLNHMLYDLISHLP